MACATCSTPSSEARTQQGHGPAKKWQGEGAKQAARAFTVEREGGTFQLAGQRIAQRQTLGGRARMAGHRPGTALVAGGLRDRAACHPRRIASGPHPLGPQPRRIAARPASGFASGRPGTDRREGDRRAAGRNGRRKSLPKAPAGAPSSSGPRCPIPDRWPAASRQTRPPRPGRPRYGSSSITLPGPRMRCRRSSSQRSCRHGGST